MQVGLAQQRDSKIRFLTHLEFKWNPATFKVLGVHFSTNIEIIPSVNYECKLLEIQKPLNAWSKRHLTPLGKNAVIKSLGVSEITHLTMKMIKHLMDEEGNIWSFDDFHESFPNVGLDFLTYHRQ